MISPFTTAYLKQEIDFYNPVPYEKDGMEVYLKPIEGLTRIDEFFNRGFWDKGPDIPILKKDGSIWMSLTWMEVQSHWLPIQLAHGNVLVGGLGMGYAALRFAAKRDVKKVVVYETDRRVINFFEETKAHREEYAKIEVIEGDIREVTGEYDFAYIDIYATLLPDELLEDAGYFVDKEDLSVGTFHFWGQELAVLSAYGSSEISYHGGLLGDLIDFWLDEDKEGLMSTVPDTDYCWDLINALDLEI